MLSELKAEFPAAGIPPYKFIDDRFRITKRDAEQFWKQSFDKRL
jgi:hypothetical protein